MSAPQRRSLSLGIDVGGTNTSGVVLDAEDAVLAECELPTRRTVAGVRASIAAVADRLAGDLGVSRLEFATVGVGIPGIVMHATGVVETAVNLGIERVHLGGLLAQDFGVVAKVDNDVKATALGAWSVLGSPREGICYLNLGTGVGAAAVTGGEVVRGDRNGAGEIGHFSVDAEGDVCGCGQRGCLETLVGGVHLSKRLAERGLELAALGAGRSIDAVAERKRIATAAATAVTLLTIAYDPTRVIVGGGVARGARWLLPRVADELRARAHGSAFLSRLAVADRLGEIPSGIPVPAIGAAVLGRGIGPRPSTPPSGGVTVA